MDVLRNLVTGSIASVGADSCPVGCHSLHGGQPTVQASLATTPAAKREFIRCSCHPPPRPLLAWDEVAAAAAVTSVRQSA